MTIMPLECGNCGAKLKLKSGAMRLNEVKCPRCARMIPVPKETPGAPAAFAPPAPAPAAPAAETLPAAPLPPAAASTPTPPPAGPVPAPQPAAAPAPPPAPEAKRPIVINPLGKTSISLVSAACSACQREMKVPADLAGKKIRCKNCGAVIAVPAADGKEAAPAPVTVTPPAPAPVAAPPAPAPVSAPAAPASPAAVTQAPAADLSGRLAAAERRAHDAEKAFQELAGQKAMENMHAGRRIGELEAQLATLQSVKADAMKDLAAQLDAAEKRVVELKQRLAALSST